jgi:hypothetical protein
MERWSDVGVGSGQTRVISERLGNKSLYRPDRLKLRPSSLSDAATPSLRYSITPPLLISSMKALDSRSKSVTL